MVSIRKNSQPTEPKAMPLKIKLSTQVENLTLTCKSSTTKITRPRSPEAFDIHSTSQNCSPTKVNKPKFKELKKGFQTPKQLQTKTEWSDVKLDKVLKFINRNPVQCNERIALKPRNASLLQYSAMHPCGNPNCDKQNCDKTKCDKRPIDSIEHIHQARINLREIKRRSIAKLIQEKRIEFGEVEDKKTGLPVRQWHAVKSTNPPNPFIPNEFPATFANKANAGRTIYHAETRQSTWDELSSMRKEWLKDRKDPTLSYSERQETDYQHLKWTQEKYWYEAEMKDKSAKEMRGRYLKPDDKAPEGLVCSPPEGSEYETLRRRAIGGKEWGRPRILNGAQLGMVRRVFKTRAREVAKRGSGLGKEYLGDEICKGMKKVDSVLSFRI
jgi:hypothetical protein